MGKILNFPKRPKPPNRRITIELNSRSDETLIRCQMREGLNPSTIYARALEVYDYLIAAQERGENIIVGKAKLTIQ